MQSIRLRRRGSLVPDGIEIDCYLRDDDIVSGHFRRPSSRDVKRFELQLAVGTFARLFMDFQLRVGAVEVPENGLVAAYRTTDRDDCRYFISQSPFGLWMDELRERLDTEWGSGLVE